MGQVRIKLICPYCKKEFSKRQNQLNARIKGGAERSFCSRSCSRRFYLENKKVQTNTIS